jgi:plasmid stabilization system protein ParE
MARYRVSRKAVRDPDEIWYFIAKDNETAASRQIERLYSLLKTLATQPLMGARGLKSQLTCAVFQWANRSCFIKSAILVYG